MVEARDLYVPVARPGQRAAAVLAVAVHVLLALFLIYGIRWQSSLPDAVEVELVRSVSSPAPQKSPEPVKEPVPERVKPQPPKPEPKPEPLKPPPKPDIAVKDKEKPKPKPEPKPVYDPIQDALKKEMEQSRRQQMSNAASQELAQLQSSSPRSSKSKADYQGKIAAKIRGNLMVPPGVSGNPEAEFRVNQLPTGEVVEVRLKRSSGHKALDEAIERAIYKSSPLPKPERPEDFARELELKFRPLDPAAGY
ncbi:MAG: TonB C-terminal domain-containing protein [Rhodocyclaceae bacterium]|nr:TonB C-terminal domain-containing protein [Rhodocyclaceae bacterium]